MDDEPIFTEEDRAELCIDDDCEEHSNGNWECQIPKTKGEARIAFAEEGAEKETSSTAMGRTTPLTATADVVRSDE